jgi:hypothetical protein
VSENRLLPLPGAQASYTVPPNHTHSSRVITHGSHMASQQIGHSSKGRFFFFSFCFSSSSSSSSCILHPATAPPPATAAASLFDTAAVFIRLVKQARIPAAPAQPKVPARRNAHGPALPEAHHALARVLFLLLLSCVAFAIRGAVDRVDRGRGRWLLAGAV